MNELFELFNRFRQVFGAAMNAANKIPQLAPFVTNLDLCCKICTLPENYVYPFFAEYHDQTFIFNDLGYGKDIIISWNIDLMTQELASVQPHQISYRGFEKEFSEMLARYSSLFQELRADIHFAVKHTADSLIILNIPFNGDDIFLDGKHRYAEYLNGCHRRRKRISVYYVSATLCFQSLARPADRATYAFLHNLHAIASLVLYGQTEKYIFHVSPEGNHDLSIYELSDILRGSQT